MEKVRGRHRLPTNGGSDISSTELGCTSGRPLLKGKLSIVFHDYVCVDHKIESKIMTIKNQRVILDSDLAQLYGVSTMRLNEQVPHKFSQRARAKKPGLYAFKSYW